MSEGQAEVESQCPSMSRCDWMAISRGGPHSHGLLSSAEVFLAPSRRNQVPLPPAPLFSQPSASSRHLTKF